MKKIPYIVSMLFVALLGASAAIVGQSVAAEAPKANCVTSFDYSKMSDEQYRTLFPESPR